MVRPDVVRAKRDRALAWLRDVEELLARSPEELRVQRRERDLSLFYLFLAIQEVIDLAAHWVASEGWVPPDDAGSSFDLLAERRQISPDDADLLRGATGLRNRIAHGYAQIEIDRVIREAHEGLPALRRFLDAIERTIGS